VQLYILKKLVLPFFSRVDKRADIFVIPWKEGGILSDKEKKEDRKEIIIIQNLFLNFWNIYKL
jgi:hypothetical protein